MPTSRQIDKLRAGGAVILGKTNVPEFTSQGYTDNPLFGPTRNPYDLALTPGGSSGGAVAAVATGMGPIAMGTDGGGSIRRPAAHTGLVGFKPSRGMVPRRHGFPAILHDLEVIGPIARNVDDILTAMDVIGGPDWRPPSAGVGRARILYIPTFSGAPVDREIAAAVADIAIKLAEQGHSVETAHDFDLAGPIADIWPVVSQSGLAWLMAQHGDRDDMISPSLAEMARNGRRYSAADYLAALDTIKAVGRAFDALFQRFDVLLTPTAAAMPWPATEIYPGIIDGHPVGPRGHAVFTPFANALGLPAISLPARPVFPRSADRLPACRGIGPGCGPARVGAGLQSRYDCPMSADLNRASVRPASPAFETASVPAARRYMSEVFRSHELSCRARRRDFACGMRR